MTYSIMQLRGDYMGEQEDLLGGLVLELRRGTIVLSVLSQLEKPKYGYALVQILNDKEISVEANTLYPLLRRLEKQGLLQSEWETSGTKPRKYYVRTQVGTEVNTQLKKHWEKIVDSMNKLLSGEE